jgi:hypothetical protein
MQTAAGLKQFLQFFQQPDADIPSPSMPCPIDHSPGATLTRQVTFQSLA